MYSQKNFVVQLVKTTMGTAYNSAVACLSNLSTADLEAIKKATGFAISNGTVDYSKDRSNSREVISYARSMVMNHLKKAKELNGGSSVSNNSSTKASRRADAEDEVEDAAEGSFKGIDLSLLPDELRAVVQTL